MLFLWLLTVASSRIAVASHVLSESKMNPIQMLSAGDEDTLQVEISTTTGAMTILLDNEPWLFAGDSPLRVDGWPDLSILHVHSTDGDDQMHGPFHRTTLAWGSTDKSDDTLIETSVVAYSKRELIAFEQYWPKGWSPPTLSQSGDSNRTILAAFPSVGTSSPSGLRFLAWGGCMVANPRSGSWDGTANSKTLFDGVTTGEPLLLHKGTAGKTRALVLSSKENFFVSGQAASPDGKSIDCGIRNTVHSLPKSFSHSTVLVAGRGINGTMMDWGDVLLGISGKQRTNPYNDFVLAHLGYWTDNGAYYYMGVHTNYSNSEETLKAVKAYLAKRRIPARYMQWDDWWMESKGDRPGITSWTPKKSVFPSGFTDWLDLPLSLYAPMYSSENDWTDRYHFKNDPNGNPTAIPLDPAFYQDLFHNGTTIDMKMFEQDFLCSQGIGGTGLTNTDVDTGKLWMEHMDVAALKTGTTLQFCMMDPYHALHSTLVKSMTNGRATYDNTRDYDSIMPMGQTGLLFYSLGFFASRDNGWTTNPDVEQPSCANQKYCYEPNAHADNAVAVLGGGPYGIADAVGFTNRTLVMYACRNDGVMLKPRWPLSSLDFTFTDPDSIGTLVWAAHDDYGPLRWSYIIGINLDRDVAITLERLQGLSSGPMVAWKVEVGVPVTSVIPFSDQQGPFYLPAGPVVPKGPSLSHWATAPILPNGAALLGEDGKWTTMSGRRVASLIADSSTVTLALFGAPGEKTVFAYVPASSSAVSQVECDFGTSSSCDMRDVHGNTDCLLELICTPQRCSCSPVAQFFVRDKVLLHGSFGQEQKTGQA